MALMEQIIARKDEILKLADHYGASNVRVFGSVARGDDDENSDIDFLVSYPKDYDLFQQIDLANELEKIFMRKIDVIEERSLHRIIKDDVLNEARVIQ